MAAEPTPERRGASLPAARDAPVRPRRPRRVSGGETTWSVRAPRRGAPPVRPGVLSLIQAETRRSCTTCEEGPSFPTAPTCEHDWLPGDVRSDQLDGPHLRKNAACSGV